MRWGQPLIVACLILLGAGTARAGCSVSVSGLAFGTYNVFSTAHLDTTGTIVYQCDNPDKRIRITLSPGSSGTFGQRTMRRGADILQYNLFLDAFSSVWGDGTGGTDYYYIHNPPNKTPITLTLYGRVFAQQDVTAGFYTDTVQVMIDF